MYHIIGLAPEPPSFSVTELSTAVLAWPPRACIDCHIHPTASLHWQARICATHLEEWHQQLRTLETRFGVDLCVLSARIYDASISNSQPPLCYAFFDMDSTLIQQEVIDEIAREAGCFDAVAVKKKKRFLLHLASLCQRCLLQAGG